MSAPALSWLRPLARLAVAGAVALLAGCGGGGGDNPAALTGDTVGTSSVAAPAVTGANVLQILVDKGTDGTSINSPFVTVTVCQPGTATCVDVDHVVLDTGSSGLRVAASALPAGWLGPIPATAGLPAVTDAGGALVGQCAQFASGFSWGSVRRADVRMGGEATTAAVSVQVVNDTSAAAYASIPAACTGTGPNIGPGRGAKGILGVGFSKEDCGTACEAPARPNFYFACNGLGGCTATSLARASQVSNPVISFGANNNGVVLVLPAVPSGGAALATGSLILGVATQPNNQLGSATVFAADPVNGTFTTNYKGTLLPNSFLDSGSNGMFFNDPALPSCGDFYCPGTSPLPLSATNTSATGVSQTVDFFIDSVTQIRSDAAAAHIGGTSGIPNSFDFGLPFFFGRSVFLGFAAPDGPGPFWAY